jgi:hypothetical protein
MQKYYAFERLRGTGVMGYQVFVSHKHSDAQLAGVLAKFIRAKSLKKVSVHLSSDPAFKGPKIGRSLNQELRSALSEANVLFLLYTSSDLDWSYCMWECGLATDPKSPSTNIVVFQCGRDVPNPFGDVVRVNARQLDDLRRFTKAFFTDPAFFSGGAAALAPEIDPSDCDEYASELHAALAQILPPIEHEASEDWSVWPLLRLELPLQTVDGIGRTSVDKRVEAARKALETQAIVATGDQRLPQLFGKANFPARMPFSDLCKIESEKAEGQQSPWFDACAEQIAEASARGLPIVRWAPLKAAHDKTEHVPVLTRVRREPAENRAIFDLYFYNLLDPRAVPISSKMIPRRSFFCKELGKFDASALKLRDLVAEMKSLGRNRIPLLNAAGHPMYIVHRSMVDQFISTQSMEGSGAKPVQDLTLSDLLADPFLQVMFKSSFAVVSRRASQADASKAMNAITDCRDVFVTQNGGADEAVVGWVTNVDMMA